MSEKASPGHVSSTSAKSPVSPTAFLPRNGYNVKSWTEKVVLPLVKRDAENKRYLFPDPLVDFKDWSRAHSWYKHFRRCPGKFFPILRIGVESGGIRGGENDVTLKEKELHWAFIEERFLFQEVKELQDGYHYSMLPWQIMSDCFFHVSNLFSELNLETNSSSETFEMSAFSVRCMLAECSRVRDRITRMLLAIDPNPPMEMLILFDPKCDSLVPTKPLPFQFLRKTGCEQGGEREEDNGIVSSETKNVAKEDKEGEYWVIINKRRYKFYFEENLEWKTLKNTGFGHNFVSACEFYHVYAGEEEKGSLTSKLQQKDKKRNLETLLSPTSSPSQKRRRSMSTTPKEN